MAQPNGNGTNAQRKLLDWFPVGVFIITMIAAYGAFSARMAASDTKQEATYSISTATATKVDGLAIEQAKQGERIEALTARVDELTREKK